MRHFIEHLGLIHRLRQAGESLLAMAGFNDLLDLSEKIEQLLGIGGEE